MIHIAGPTQRERIVSDLCTSLRTAGMVLARCDSTGRLYPLCAEQSDWLEQLLLTSKLIERAVEKASVMWDQQTSPGLIELIPGCFAMPAPITRRRERTGYGLALIPTAELLETEQFHALCQAAKLDRAACAMQFAAIKPVPRSEVDRVGQLAKCLLEDLQRLGSMSRTIESVSQQLAESYEEISLLYTISESMTVVQRPRRFVQSACEGLLATLPYRWIAAKFVDESDALPTLAGKLIVAGRPPRAHDVVAPLAPLIDRLIASQHVDAPRVIDPTASPEHRVFRPLGQPILLHPITREGRMLGILIAAEKYGADRAASSADMKLLGAAASHTGIFLENAALYEDKDAMFLGMLEALTASIDAKDRYTCGHSLRVALLSQQLAVAARLDEETIRRVHVAGLVHDVGKIGVPEAVLLKPGKLTKAEFDLIKQHPAIGYRILKDVPQLKDILPGVLHHHERWDGGGYPDGLKGEESPLFARLIALCDSFDAMSSTRTYRAAMDRETVLREITRLAGSQFDPTLVPFFVALDFSAFDALVVEHRAASLTDGISKGEAA